MDERHIVSIDLGTSKFAIAVAKVEGDNIHIIYYKEHPAHGIRYSRILNPTQASRELKKGIETAEQELGIKITQVIVGMPKYEVRQEAAHMTMERNPEELISKEEINNLKEMAIDTYPLANPEAEVLFGAVAQSFSNGEEFQIVEEEFEGMAGNQIEGNFKLFIGRASSIRNIDLAFNNIGICVARKYFTPDSTAKAVLSDSEMDNGVALIDFGAGVTSLSIYYGNIMRHYAAIPFGGSVITKDIKSESSISETLAENIKLAFGACMPDKLQNMSEKILHITSSTTSHTKILPVKYLSEIITARVREIIEAVLYEIQASGMADQLKSGIVLTGGCANLANCANLIKEMSGYSVRTGYPKKLFSVSGCEGIYESNAAVSVGMILTGKQEKNLNCLLPVEKTSSVEIESEYGQEPQPEEENTGIQEDDIQNDGTLFGTGGESKDTPEQQPRAKEPKKPKPPKTPKGVTWVKDKFSSLGNLFGSYYDEISKEIDNEQI
ncbi:MAG: cell division protein FtsA [Bacteroidales bacterium]|nr:cell division protein FtsA [Bacteroidales bacterium]